MWKQSAAILLFSGLLLVGCNNDAVEDTRNETPMEDTNRGTNEGVMDEDGITEDGVNNSGNHPVERGINDTVNDIEGGANDVRDSVERGVNDVTDNDTGMDDNRK